MFAGSAKRAQVVRSGGKKKRAVTKTVASRNTGDNPPPAHRVTPQRNSGLLGYFSPKSTESDAESTVGLAAKSPASSDGGGTVVQTPATHGHTRVAATPVSVDKYPTDPKNAHYQSYMSSKDTIVFPGAVRARAKELAASARMIGTNAMKCQDEKKKAELYQQAVLEQTEAKRLEASIVDTLAAHEEAVRMHMHSQDAHA